MISGQTPAERGRIVNCPADCTRMTGNAEHTVVGEKGRAGKGKGGEECKGGEGKHVCSEININTKVGCVHRCPQRLL